MNANMNEKKTANAMRLANNGNKIKTMERGNKREISNVALLFICFEIVAIFPERN